MRRLRESKLPFWLILAGPAVAIAYRYSTTQEVWPGDMLEPTGEWSARFIIAALALTPLAQLFPGNAAVRWLIRRRRAIGVAAFAYSLLHLGFYVADMETVANMVAELGAPAIWTGWFALLCLLPPALASNDAAMRALGRSWKRVQRFAYPAALLTLVHWMLVHDGRIAALAHFAPLALLQSIRLARSFNFTPKERTIA